jgi:hypothetical protein
MSLTSTRGAIVTFYSWKGGVGRTMALANIAVQLVRLGRSVLMVDWDLEAPGHERYFDHPEILGLTTIATSDASGLLGLLEISTAVVPERAIWETRLCHITVPPRRGQFPNPQPAYAGATAYVALRQSQHGLFSTFGGVFLEPLFCRTNWRGLAGSAT